MQVKKGDAIKVGLSLKAIDGIEIDGKKHLLDIKVGKRQILEGIDEAVIGMKPGEAKNVTLDPEKAYGKRKKGFTMKVPRKNYKGTRIRKGDAISLMTENGSRQMATVHECNEEEVVCDMNHPLAGRALTFYLEVVRFLNGDGNGV